MLVNDASKGRVPNIAQKEPSIAVFGAHIVVGWNDRTIEFGQTLRGVKNGVGHGFSTDGGATFTDAGEVGTSHWGADPSVAVDRSGNFYFGRIDLHLMATAVKRPALADATARPREPFGVAELFRHSLLSAKDFRDRRP